MMGNSVVYMVTFDGFFGSYGSQEYLLGIFPSLEEAKAAVKKYVDFANTWLEKDNGKYIRDSYKIHSVNFGETLPMVYKDEWFERISTPIYLGGYVE